MENEFFNSEDDLYLDEGRLRDLRLAKVGFYSIGLYPASLAYNCAMQSSGEKLLLAPRDGRLVLGAFSEDLI